MIVTVDLPLSKVYRNAFFFFLMRFIQFAVMTVVIILLLFLLPFIFISSFTYFGYGLAIIYYLTMAFVLCQFMMAYYSADMINTFIVKKLQAPAESEEESDDDDSSDEDSDEEEDPDDESDEESDDDDQEDDEEDGD